ncbi:fused MFS/spermidine synthase [Halorussus salilacus]|uniref:spermidine synthase n=1 Tax=Halorussus salilacus TaxID=2953750 RepID=UPI0020A05D2B|nr:fused MFS/spermidine synthase [Halorussus salilacus]USZ68331.1 fused MFS/spermidine synthase [Halorussus salilacus]
MGDLREYATDVTKPEVAVFVSGVASMGLEILAGRIVAPQYGSSIYTWGSIIAVFLAALSLGYHYGGKRAASRATTDRLIRLFVLTAGYVAVVIFADDLLLAAAAAMPLPYRFASLPAVILLFGLPTYLLGFVSPYAAQLSEKEGVGEASGHVYAVGTIGSIVGAFGTTFFLIPALGIDRIALAFGLLLTATAVWLAAPRLRRRSVFAALAVSLVLVAAVASGSLGFSTGGKVVYQTQTPYQELEVADLGDTRTLYLDGQRHSAMDKSDPDRHVFDYTRYFHAPYLFADDPDDIDRVLFVGGGGFTGPKRFVEEYNATVDVVEIDPEVIDVAERYFGVEESEQLNVHNADGRQFLRETDREYDLIVLDAYKKDKVPFQLTTVEFMQLANDRLSEEGMLFANLISAPDGSASQFYRAEYKTMARVFPQVYAFPTSETGAVQNIELVATKNDTRITEAQLRERNDRRDIGIDLSAEIESYRHDESTDDVPVLTDDHAPVDSLMDPMMGQRYVVEESERNESEDRPRARDARPGASVAPSESAFDLELAAPGSGPATPDLGPALTAASTTA